MRMIDQILTQLISIHALHEESDTTSTPKFTLRVIFQSTLSMRRATTWSYQLSTMLPISIHALHEESDYRCHNRHRQGRLISIHALHEESDENLMAMSNFTY